VVDSLRSNGCGRVAGVAGSADAHALLGALALFLLQLALNLTWSWIFFREHAIGLAPVEVVVLWVAVGATTLAFGRVAPLAAWLMVPYLAWVAFATVLNAAFWRLN